MSPKDKLYYILILNIGIINCSPRNFLYKSQYHHISILQYFFMQKYPNGTPSFPTNFTKPKSRSP